MNTVLRLVFNDLKRDWKNPWSMLLLAALPLVLSLLIALVFGGKGGSGPMPTLQIAVLDEDKDLLTDLLRSFPSQGEGANRLRLHFVDNREQGLKLVQKSQVSAFVVLPKQLTENLLKGQTNSIELYENPAEQVLPKVVREGVSLMALGLSGAAEILGDPLRNFRDMVRSNDFPADLNVSGVASSSVSKLRGFRTYLFPPLVKLETISARDFTPVFTNTPAGPGSP